jgi:hypothetical protein
MQLVKFLGKVQFTMALLLVGMVVMTIGTVVESRQSRDVAQVLIYGAFWFDVFLFLIAVNLVMAVVNRIPLKRRQWPVVFTHVSLVTLLVGCWISHTFGYEGRMMIFEGGEESQIHLDAMEIRARWHREADASSPRDAGAVRSEASFPLPLGRPIRARELQRESEGRPGLRVVESVARGVAGESLVESGPEGAPGIELALLGPQVHVHQWLLADGESAGRKRLGPLDVEFLVVSAPPAFEFLAAPVPAQAWGDSGALLTIQPRQGGDPVRISLPESLGREIVLDTGVVARVERLLLRARMVDGELVDVPTAGLNPAALVVVESGGRSEQHTVFARFPDFAAIHGRESGAEALVGELRLDASGLVSRALVTVILGPEGGLHVKLPTEGGGQAAAVPLSVGDRVELGDRGLAVALEKFHARARSEVVVAPTRAGQEGGNAYVRLEASLGGHRESVWLGRGFSEVLRLGSHTLEVAFAQQTRPVPFSLALEKFEVVNYPGSRRPAEYRSTARLTPASPDRAPRDVVISMNRPLDEAGFRLFQSSYQLGRGGRPDMTILSVSYDPGVPVVYASFALIVMGIAWYVQAQRRRLRFSARETGGVSTLVDSKGLI